MKTSLSILMRQTFQRRAGLYTQSNPKLFQNNITHLQMSYSRLQHYLLSNVNRSFSTLPPSVLRTICSHSVNRRMEKRHYKTLSASACKEFHFSEKSKIHNNASKSIFNVAAKRSNSDKDLIATSKSDSDSSVVLDRYIYVKTMDRMYEDIPNGIVLDTAYGDSRPNADFDPSMPVIVALHDTPGTHKDVVPLLSFFAKLGCRTICPTFPGHGDTRGIMRNFDDIFSQVTMERATFVHDFLGDLGIKRVDVLVGIGASSYTAMALCTQMNEIYKSMALISPWPLSQTRFEVNNKMLKHIRELWEMVYFRPIARLLLPGFSIANAMTIQEKMTACYMVENLDLGEADGFALTTAVMDIPRLVAYGAKDDLVSEEMYKDVLSRLGIEVDKVTSDHREMWSKGGLNRPNAVVFPDSGYDLLTPYHSALSAYILQLLQQFHPHIRI